MVCAAISELQENSKTWFSTNTWKIETQEAKKNNAIIVCKKNGFLGENTLKIAAI